MRTSNEPSLQPPETQSAIEAAERFLGQGEPLLAYNAVQEGLETAPGNLRLRQLQGLTTARSGDVGKANQLLAQLASEGVQDAETLGMLARTHKDLGLSAIDPSRRRFHLDAGFQIYSRAFEAALKSGDAGGRFYTGINAATMAVLRDDLSAARRIAGSVRDTCLLRRGDGNASIDYWLEATLGEALLILGDSAGAAESYACAASLVKGRYGDLGATRRQAQLLADRLPGDHSWIASILGIPPVVMFTGHMIDLAARIVPRFPVSEEAAMHAMVLQQVARIRPAAAYGSAACGSDILYLEAMREIGGETHVVLPFKPDEFRRVSVDIAGGNWGERFERVIAAANSVTVTSDHRASGSTAPFEYANLILSGIARLRAQLLSTKLLGLAIWDGKDAGGAGGAASLVRLWRSQGFAVDELRCPEPRPDSRPTVRSVDAAPVVAAMEEQLPEGFEHEMRAMLFADAVGYSKLSEDQTPLFVTQFLGAVADLSASTTHQPEHVETTGDGIYMVFRDARQAAHYALELNKRVTGTDWAASGLPGGLNIRIALHCGPVYCGRNPLTGARIYTGPHTSRTARIEPVTPPGQVYASSAFAAVASVLGGDDLNMTYVGRMALAKGYGSLGLYHVRAAT
jgi:class 3 adenylate cyclase